MPQSWPSDLIPDSCEFFLQHNTRALVSPLTRKAQVLRMQGEIWRCSIAFDVTERAISQRMDALLAKLHGGDGAVTLWDFARPTPSGDNRLKVGTSNATLVGAHSAGATSLATTGWFASVAGILLTGDYIGIGGKLYMLTDDANSDGSNNATLLIAPPLRADNAGGSVITRTEPTDVFQLVDDNQSVRQVVSTFGSYALSFVEATGS